MKKYNVLLIMTDQHRGDCLHSDGNETIQTPYLDHLASDGVRFSHAYSACPSCIPARAVLMTGQTPWKTGILGMGEGQKPMRSDYLHTLPGELAKAGYHTQLVGKMHFNPPRALNGFHNTVLDEHDYPDFKSDYQIWFEKNAPGESAMREHGIGWNDMIARPFHLPEVFHPTNWTVRESLKFLNIRRDVTKTFFLCTSFIRPHSPYDPPRDYWDMYSTRNIPGPFISEWSEKLHNIPEEAVRTDAWHGKRSDEEIRRARVGYYGSVTHIDNQIGFLLACLKKNQLYDDTLIIFTSDHGDMLGDHLLWRKTYAYESSTRIPLLVKFPGDFNISRKVADQPVELRDIMPTILETLSVPVPDTVEGKNVMKIAADKNAGWREYIHGEHCRCYSPVQEMQFVTDGKRKYIWFPRTDAEQFFNLENDPQEQYDLSGEKTGRDEIAFWKARLIKELESRNCGLVKNQRLIRQDKPIISPW
ncbi:MAG: sulfatase [Spirochaetes bacterium GWF1_41_5]|nr:MAG: sulfatase [Spirochaetes bacterium GWF1_41_5]